MADLSGFYSQITEIVRRAKDMKERLVEPFRTDNGGFLNPAIKAEREAASQILESSIKGSYYESIKQGAQVAAVNARALQNYEKTYGRLPNDDLLASCDKAIENGILVAEGKAQAGGIFEAAEMSTTDGILMRNRLISLVLPVQLTSITSNFVTFIPGEFNQSEFYRIYRVAGSNFGDLTKGDRVDYDYDGVYSAMDQRKTLGTGDGSKVKFTFSSATDIGAVYPFKPKRTRVWVDHLQVAEDIGNGAIVGSYVVSGTTVTITGTVTYATGIVEVNFSTAPAAGISIDLGFDVDIEKDPTLIPRVDHEMFSKVLYPHESAISGNATIQALWALRREIGQDIDNLIMQQMRNLLAADKDKKHLHDMLYHTKDSFQWSRKVPTGLTKQQHYESIVLPLLDIDTHLRQKNGISGLVGMVAGSQVVNLFRSMSALHFQPAPGFKSSPQPHYVGRIFNQWDLFCDPNFDSLTAMCYAKGPDHGQTAYVVGDAVPALTFRHPVLGDLVQKATMWDLSYRDMQPFDGEKYLCKFIVNDL